MIRFDESYFTLEGSLFLELVGTGSISKGLEE